MEHYRVIYKIYNKKMNNVNQNSPILTPDISEDSLSQQLLIKPKKNKRMLIIILIIIGIPVLVVVSLMGYYAFKYLQDSDYGVKSALEDIDNQDVVHTKVDVAKIHNKILPNPDKPEENLLPDTTVSFSEFGLEADNGSYFFDRKKYGDVMKFIQPTESIEGVLSRPGSNTNAMAIVIRQQNSVFLAPFGWYAYTYTGDGFNGYNTRLVNPDLNVSMGFWAETVDSTENAYAHEDILKRAQDVFVGTDKADVAKKMKGYLLSDGITYEYTFEDIKVDETDSGEDAIFVVFPQLDSNVLTNRNYILVLMPTGKLLEYKKLVDLMLNSRLQIQ